MANAPNAPNTVRLFIDKEKRSTYGILHVQQRVLEGILKMPHESIFCLQVFPQQGFFDVTFRTLSEMRTCFLRSQENADRSELQGIRFVSSELQKDKKVPVIVHMYNPFVRDEEIQTFLKRYCKSVSGAERRTNILGTFNGMRCFWVEFKPDPEGGVGGVCHPPQNFAIGTNRGFLHYPGMPNFCRDCYCFGHTREDCTTGQVCKNCYQPGHRTAECPEARKCHFCGSSDHLARSCPTYRSEASRGGSTAVTVKEVVAPVTSMSVAEPSVVEHPEEIAEVPHVAEEAESSNIVVPDPLVAEGEEIMSSSLVSEDPNGEMLVDKESLKRKIEEGSVTPLSEKIEEFSSPEEEGGSSSIAVDSDSSSSSRGASYLDGGSVKKLARTLNMSSKSMEDIKKSVRRGSQGTSLSKGGGSPRK